MTRRLTIVLDDSVTETECGECRFRRPHPVSVRADICTNDGLIKSFPRPLIPYGERTLECLEAERATAPVFPNLDDHPLQDPAAADRELRKLLYTVDADRKRADAKVRELATEVWRLRKAMQTPPLPYEYAEDWLNRVEKARGG